MKLSLARGQRPYRIPGPALAAGGLLLLLGAVVAALPANEESPVTCPFRVMTGLPCPTCGLVRAAHWLMRGHFGRAFAINPFDALFLLVVAPLAVVLGLANRAGLVVRFSLSSIERRAAWGFLAAVVLANWAYVLATHRYF